MSTQLEQIRDHAQPFLGAGEELIAALTASPRGRSTAIAAGGAGSMIGYKIASGEVKKGGQVGLRIEPNMAVALTQARLLTLKVKISMGGTITGVTEVLSAVPLSEVTAIEAKRFGLGGILVLSVGGGKPVKLECRVGRARELVDAFNQTVGRAAA
jgi:hypothetical protein